MSERSERSERKPTRAQIRLDPEVRRAQLVRAAAGVFRGREPSSVSFEEVAEAAGVSRSLVYNYFGDRGGLIAAVYLHDLEKLDGDLGEALDDRLPDEVRLRRIIRKYLAFARDNRHTWELISSIGALQHPAVQAAKRDRIDRIAAAWGGDREARLVARGVVGLLEASADDWVSHRDCGIERATEVVFQILWSGLSGLPANAVAV
jgi:AcrR family transcriptional regulator